MKRVYESPVMMAEAFVANEYVAGCWIVTCEGFHEKPENTNFFYSATNLQKKNTEYTHPSDGVLTRTYKSEEGTLPTTSLYEINPGGQPTGNTAPFPSFGDHVKCSIVKNEDPAHPNASA